MTGVRGWYGREARMSVVVFAVLEVRRGMWDVGFGMCHVPCHVMRGSARWDATGIRPGRDV
jgi:hypothetical protein